MKTRTKIICHDGNHEIAIVLSVRTNQPGMLTLCNYEHKQKHDAALNAVHDALRKVFDVREIKIK